MKDILSLVNIENISGQNLARLAPSIDTKSIDDNDHNDVSFGHWAVGHQSSHSQCYSVTSCSSYLGLTAGTLLADVFWKSEIDKNNTLSSTLFFNPT